MAGHIGQGKQTKKKKRPEDEKKKKVGVTQST